MNINAPPPPKSGASWLSAVRAAYLDFLRNLTPQVLLASLTWLLWSKLEFSRIDWSNWFHTSLFFVSFGLFAFAAYANAAVFLSRLSEGIDHWRERRSNELKDEGIEPRAIGKLLGKDLFVERRRDLILLFVALVVVQVCLAFVLVVAIAAAADVSRGLQGTG